MNIRELNESDSCDIARLSAALGYPSNREQIIQRFRKLKNSDTHILLCAEKDGKILGWIHGFVSLRIESDPFLEIGGLVVDAGSRRLGIGKRLVEKLVQAAALQGLSKIRVRCNSRRTEAHQFYQQLGFFLAKDQMVFDLEVNAGRE